MRIGTPSARPPGTRKSPTAIATRYDDIFGVSEMSALAAGFGPGVSDTSWPLRDRRVASIDRQGDRERRFEGRFVERWEARRASVDSNWVTA